MTARSARSLVTNSLLTTRARVREGSQIQSFQLRNLGTTGVSTLALPVGTQGPRLYVFGARRASGGGNVANPNIVIGATSFPFTTTTNPAFAPITVTPAGNSRFTIRAIYYTVNITLAWPQVTITQGYQVPFIVQIPRPFPSNSGHLIFRYGQVLTGGVQTVALTGPTTVSTLTAPNGVITFTKVTGTAQANTDVIRVGRMLSATTANTIVLTGTATTTYTIFGPPTLVGALTSGPQSTIKTFSFNGTKYRPGDTYTGNERLASSYTIKGVPQIIFPPGAGIAPLII